MLLFLFFFFSLLLSPCSTLFPYTTLFRSKLYIDLFRGLPIIVTLFMTFFLLPELNIMLNSYFSAVAGLSVWCRDRKSTRLNSSHVAISYAVFCLKKKKKDIHYAT